MSADDVAFAAERIRKAFDLSDSPDGYGRVYKVLGYAYLCAASSPSAKEAGDMLAEIMRSAGMAGEVAKAEAWAESRRSMLAQLMAMPTVIVVDGPEDMSRVAEVVKEIAEAKSGSSPRR